MNYQSEREEFCHAMGKNGRTLTESRTILRLANTVQRLAVEACNRELTPEEEKRDKIACEKIAAEFAPWPVSFQGDPRGAVVKFKKPDGLGNDFGGDGWSYVPTRPY
jgi:hypothetical protein